MAKCSDLDIYKELNGFYREIRSAIRAMPRKERYDVGADLKNACRLMLTQVYKANGVRGEERVMEIDELLTMMFQTEVMVGECVEDGLMRHKGKGNISLAMRHFGAARSQAVKWKNYTEGKV